MTREELEKMFDDEFGELYHLINVEEYGWRETPMSDNVKQFIFDTIIPEVLKSIMSDLKDTQSNDEGINMMRYGNNVCIYEIKQKAKELYNINL